MTNPAIEAVVKAMREHQIDGTDHALELMATDYAAAVLDNMPRAEMINKVAYEDCWREVISHSKGSLDAEMAEVNRTWKRHIPKATEHVDAAISAARATLLPGDET